MNDDIQAALATQLLTVTAIDASVVAWENRPFTPTFGTPWYRATYLPGETQAAGVGTNAQNRYIGVYQVDVFYPSGDGQGDATAKADEIITAFKRGTVLTYDGVSVRVVKAYRGNGREEPDWYHIPVIINWRSDIEN